VQAEALRRVARDIAEGLGAADAGGGTHGIELFKLLCRFLFRAGICRFPLLIFQRSPYVVSLYTGGALAVLPQSQLAPFGLLSSLKENPYYPCYSPHLPHALELPTLI
jgi:hypothetical protein